MQKFTIPDAYDPTQVYLKRLRIIQTPWFGVYLHWIYLPDRDRDPHDHPWPFVSMTLKGGYVEEITDPTKGEIWSNSNPQFTGHTMPMHLAHRIRHLDPGTVTLVLVGARKRTWGFWTPEGFVPWHNYVDANGNRKTGPDPFDS